MDETQNPYAPPKSHGQLLPSQGAGTRTPVFSPSQGLLGTFLGGPLAGVYFLRANYLAKGEAKRATLTTVWGIVLSLALLCAIPFLPERLPSPVIPLAYTLTVRAIIEKLQFTKAQIASSNTFTFASNGKVAGITAIAFLIFCSALVVEVFLLAWLSTGADV
jgi:hypothetical protein